MEPSCEGREIIGTASESRPRSVISDAASEGLPPSTVPVASPLPTRSSESATPPAASKTPPTKQKKTLEERKPRRRHRKRPAAVVAAAAAAAAVAAATSVHGSSTGDDSTEWRDDGGSEGPLDEAELAAFLATRPTADALRAANILRDPGADMARRNAAATALLRRLAARPTPGELRDKNVLRGSAGADPSLRATQDAVVRQQHKDHLSRSLRNQPPVEELVRRNIMRIAPPRDDAVSDSAADNAAAAAAAVAAAATGLIGAVLDAHADDTPAEAGDSTTSHRDGDGAEGIDGDGSAYRRTVRAQVERLAALLRSRPPVGELLRDARILKPVMMWTLLELGSGGGAADGSAATGLVDSASHSGGGGTAGGPSPRSCASLTLIGRRLYALGGLAGSTLELPMDPPFVLDLDTSAWHRPATRSAADCGFRPRSRYAHSATSYGPYLLLFGGYGGGEWLHDLWILDTRRGAAATAAVYNDDTVTSLYVARGQSTARGVPPGFFTNGGSTLAVSVDDVRAAARGTRRGDDTRADDGGLAWYLPPLASPVAPPPRAAHVAVLLPATAAGCGPALLVHGGNDGAGLFSDVWVLQLGSAPLSWTRVTPVGASPPPRSGHSAVLAPGGRIVMFGGGEGWGGECFNDLAVLELGGSGGVEPASSMAAGTPLPPSRESGLLMDSGAAAVESPLARQAGSPQPTASHTQPLRATWVRPACSGAPPAPRCGHAALLLRRRSTMLVFGGCDARRAFNDVHLLDINTMAWSRPADSGAVPPPRGGAAAVALGGRVVVLLGGSGPDGVPSADLHALDTDFNSDYGGVVVSSNGAAAASPTSPAASATAISPAVYHEPHAKASSAEAHESASGNSRGSKALRLTGATAFSSTGADVVRHSTSALGGSKTSRIHVISPVLEGADEGGDDPGEGILKSEGTTERSSSGRSPISTEGGAVAVAARPSPVNTGAGNKGGVPTVPAVAGSDAPLGAPAGVGIAAGTPHIAAVCTLSQADAVGLPTPASSTSSTTTLSYVRAVAAGPGTSRPVSVTKPAVGAAMRSSGGTAAAPASATSNTVSGTRVSASASLSPSMRTVPRGGANVVVITSPSIRRAHLGLADGSQPSSIVSPLTPGGSNYSDPVMTAARRRFSWSARESTTAMLAAALTAAGATGDAEDDSIAYPRVVGHGAVSHATTILRTRASRIAAPSPVGQSDGRHADLASIPIVGDESAPRTGPSLAVVIADLRSMVESAAVADEARFERMSRELAEWRRERAGQSRALLAVLDRLNRGDAEAK